MRTGQRGAVLITGIVLLVVIAVMVATLGFLYVANLKSSSLHSSSEQAYFAALSGLERATRVVNSPTLAGAVAPDVNRMPCASLTGDAAVTAVNLVANKGQFTVTGGAAVSPATPVTLNGALTAAAQAVTVAPAQRRDQETRFRALSVIQRGTQAARSGRTSEPRT